MRTASFQALGALILITNTQSSNAGERVKGFEGTGEAMYYRGSNTGEADSVAQIVCLIGESSASLAVNYSYRVAPGPKARHYSIMSGVTYQVVEWAPWQLPNIGNGGLEDNTHILEVYTGNLPRDLHTLEFAVWASAASHTALNEGTVVPNIFPYLGDNSIGVVGIPSRLAFGIPSEFEIKIRHTNALSIWPKESQIEEFTALRYRVMLTTNITGVVLPMETMVQSFGFNKAGDDIVPLGKVTLKMNQWNGVSLTMDDFRPSLPSNSTVVDLREGLNGETVHEFGATGWEWVDSARIGNPTQTTFSESKGRIVFGFIVATAVLLMAMVFRLMRSHFTIQLK